MADKKISALTGASTPLAGTEVLPIVQSSSTVKVTVANLTAGRAISALSGTFNVGSYAAFPAVTVAASSETGRTYQMGMITGGKWALYESLGPTKLIDVDSTGNTGFYGGNLIQGTAGRGIDFTANTHASGMTSELLNWYEEGTWTVNVSSSSGTITTVGTTVGRYQRVGRNVTLMAEISITNNGTGSNALRIDGVFPFAASATFSLYSGSGLNLSTGVGLAVGFQSGAVFIRTAAAAYPVASGQAVSVTLTYQV